MPPPSMTTDLPTPALPGQSPGRGEGGLPVGGGGGGGGLPPGADCAEEEPHAASDVLMPIAAIVRNIPALPTALPIDVRNSRRAIFGSLLVIVVSDSLAACDAAAVATGIMRDHSY